MKYFRILSVLAVVWLCAVSRADNRNAYPLSEERGTAGILAALERLPVYVRVLHTTAHPDDESAGTLVWLSRDIHAQTAIFAMTRGEGGQNILGNEQYDAMGVLRTGELLEACRLYGAELFFSTAYDFGFSKSAEETLAKWGHDQSLGEMVRFIRQWRPTIILSKFQGNANDGHGHHEAAGILTREAFRAAADPARFPEQLKEGLLPWQARKLYTGGTRETGQPGVVRVPVGNWDPVLGRSYREIGVEGYAKHRSQGNGQMTALPGSTFEDYRLADSAMTSKPKEDSFFDSIDTSLSAIGDLAANEKEAAAFLQQPLKDAESSASEALRLFEPMHPERSAAAILKGIATLAPLPGRVMVSSLSTPTRNAILPALWQKLADFQDALTAVLGIYVVARTDDATGTPGEVVPVTVYVYNRGVEAVALSHCKVGLSEDWNHGLVQAGEGKLPPGGSAVFRFSMTIPTNAEPTQPFLYRTGLNEARYKVRPTRNLFAPFELPLLGVLVVYQLGGLELPVSGVVRADAGNPIIGSNYVEFQVVPKLLVSISPELKVTSPNTAVQSFEFQASVGNNQKSLVKGLLRVASPAGWRVSPESIPFSLGQKEERFNARFTVQIPAGTRAGNYPIQAIASSDGTEFREGYHTISYPENWLRNVYSPSAARVEVLDFRITGRPSVGYVMGSGDDVPKAIEQLGATVHVLSADDLAFGDLSRFQTIVTGIRAYNTNDALRANNPRLLKYVEQGGTLIVQYNRPLTRVTPGGRGAPFPYGPYPMSNSDEDRISDENSPVQILRPDDPVFNQPNKITSRDFEGWIQERGLYFLTSWDPRYTSLLSGHDPGESPKPGGMLLAHYGRGYYVYTAYAWFRQLPAGVPGAYRIFANLLSLGR